MITMRHLLAAQLPADAAAINFVFVYYEHSDNNALRDYKAPISLPDGISMDAWSAKLTEQYRCGSGPAHRSTCSTVQWAGQRPSV